MKTNIKKIGTAEQKTGTDKPMTTEQAAEYLGKSLSFIYKLTHHKKIRYYKSGRTCYFRQKDLEAFAFANPVLSDEEIETIALDKISEV